MKAGSPGSMPMRFPFCSLPRVALITVGLAGSAPSQAASLPQPDELRTRIAQGFIEMLAFDLRGPLDPSLSEAERARRDELGESLEDLITHLSEEELTALDDDHVALFRDFFERFAPEGIPLLDQLEAVRPLHTTQNLLRYVGEALEMSKTVYGQYPSTGQGMEWLREESFLSDFMRTDGWDREFAYRCSDGGAYRVTSLGADGQLGTADDWVLTEVDGIHQPAATGGGLAATRLSGEVLGGSPHSEASYLTRDVLARLGPDEVVETVLGGADASKDLVVLSGPAGSRVLLGGNEVARLPADTDLLDRSQDGLFAYVLDTDEGSHLHCGDQRVRLKDGYTEVDFLEGTNELIYRDQRAWHHFASDVSVEIEHRSVVDPTRDLWGRVHAFRRQLGDAWTVHTADAVHGPVAWASVPVLLDRGEGESDLAFRLWDGEETAVHVGSEVWHCTWAGDPFVSPDGGHVAVLANFGGTPTAHFETQREPDRRPAWSMSRAERDLAVHELFEGGRFNAIVDGCVGPDMARVLDPLFTPSGELFAYRGQTDAGTWKLIAHTSDGVTASEEFDSITGLVADPSTGSIAYDYVQDGVQWIYVHADGPVTPGRVLERLPGPKGSFAYIVDAGDGLRALYWASASSGVSWLSEPADTIHLLGWVGSDPRPVARAWSVGDQLSHSKLGLFCGHGNRLPFDEMTAAVLPDRDSNAERVAHLAIIDDECKLVVHDTSTGDIHMVGYDGRFSGARRPTILDDGRVFFEVSLDGTRADLFEYGLSDDSKVALVVFDNGNWHLSPEADHLFSVVESAEGRLAYTTQIGEQQRVEVFDRDHFVVGKLYDEVQWLSLTFLGEDVLYPAQGETRFMVRGTQEGPPVQSISQMRVLLDGTLLRYTYSDEAGSHLMLGERSIGPHDSIMGIQVRTAHELFFYEADDEDWTRTSLVLASMRPGADADRMQLTGDWLGFNYSNRDFDKVVCYLADDGVLERVVIDLAALRRSWDH